MEEAKERNIAYEYGHLVSREVGEQLEAMADAGWSIRVFQSNFPTSQSRPHICDAHKPPPEADRCQVAGETPAIAVRKCHDEVLLVRPRKVRRAMREEREDSFRRELEATLNRAAAESGSGTPDWTLAEYLLGCLAVFDAATEKRDKWYGFTDGDKAHRAR